MFCLPLCGCADKLCWLLIFILVKPPVSAPLDLEIPTELYYPAPSISDVNAQGVQDTNLTAPSSLLVKLDAAIKWQRTAGMNWSLFKLGTPSLTRLQVFQQIPVGPCHCDTCQELAQRLTWYLRERAATQPSAGSYSPKPRLRCSGCSDIFWFTVSVPDFSAAMDVGSWSKSLLKSSWEIVPFPQKKHISHSSWCMWHLPLLAFTPPSDNLHLGSFLGFSSYCK